MLSCTKIFTFEMAHAIHGYEGACRNIHGHSYQLHVAVCAGLHKGYLPAPGFAIDFKAIKSLVNTVVVELLDHKLVLSKAFLLAHPFTATQENLVVWEVEPSAENMVHFMQEAIVEKLPTGLKLASLRLYETKDSYAEWFNDDIFSSKKKPQVFK